MTCLSELFARYHWWIMSRVTNLRTDQRQFAIDRPFVIACRKLNSFTCRIETFG